MWHRDRGQGCGKQAHELCGLAEAEGKGTEAQEALFEATYEKGQNISDLQVLIEIGQKLQLPDVRPCQEVLYLYFYRWKGLFFPPTFFPVTL